MALVSKSEKARALIQKRVSSLKSSFDDIKTLMEFLKTQSKEDFKQAKDDLDKSDFFDVMGEFASFIHSFNTNEYNYENYTGPQLLAKYKEQVAFSWKNKPQDDADADQPINNDDIRNGMDERAKRLAELSEKRAQRLFLEETKKAQLTGPDSSITSKDLDKEEYDSMIDKMLLDNMPSLKRAKSTAPKAATSKQSQSELQAQISALEDIHSQQMNILDGSDDEEDNDFAQRMQDFQKKRNKS
jgi:hypothetical protein